VLAARVFFAGCARIRNLITPRPQRSAVLPSVSVYGEMKLVFATAVAATAMGE
jgi:hypothetical protein